jgi:hypothetical protein
MRVAVIIATGLGLALCADSEAQQPSTMSVFGIGHFSCANWLSNSTTQIAGQHWIDGYFTGINSLNSDHYVGQSVDSAGIYGEIAKVCREHPSQPLMNATAAVYMMLQDQKR